MEKTEDDIARMPMWKSYLYHLQQEAPQPKRLLATKEVPNKPAYYGREYHGAISRENADFLLTIGGEGSYLIRESQRAPGQYTLAIRFEGVTKNFKLYYDGQHYVGEKRFDTVQDLVADGLITFYLESKAADYIASLSSQSNYAESPYVAYNTHKKKQLAAPRRDRTHNRRLAGQQPPPSRGGEPAAAAAAERQRSQHAAKQPVQQKPSTSAAVPSTSAAGQQRPQSGSGGRSGGSSSDVAPAPTVAPVPQQQVLQDAGGARPSSGGGAGGIRKSTANIPVETRLSQIIDRQDSASKNVHPADPKASPQLSHHSPSVSASAAHTPQPRVRGSAGAGGGESSGAVAPSSSSTPATPLPTPASAAKSNREAAAQRETILARENQENLPPPPRPPHSSAHKKNSPDYQNATINREMVRQSIISQGGTPIEQPGSTQHLVGADDTDASVDDRERTSSATNTDGPKTRSKERPGSKNSLVEQRKNHNFRMFDDPHFSTPPSSPPPPPGMQHLFAGALGGGAAGGGDLKLGSVSWCTDYLEVMGSEKPHNFKLITFKGPHWCDFCANFLWGLIAQGVKCQDCGFNAHKKCSEKVPNDCMPDMKYVKRMFGIDLTTLVKAQNTLIPAVVEKCVQEIERRGVESEGLYRVAGFHDDVEAIKMSFDKDGDLTDISEAAYDDINTITSVLKLYFRLLPIPLVTFDIYFKVIDIVKRDDITDDQRIDMLMQCLLLLPPSHYHTLKYLMAHLHRVTEHKQQNMMSPENLSIVFAPTLLRSPETDPLSGLTAVKYERELIEILINHHNVLFD